MTYGDITNFTGSPFKSGWADLVQLEKDGKSYNWLQNVGADNDGNDTAIYIADHYPGNGKIKYDDFAEVWVSLGDQVSGIHYSAYGENNMNKSLLWQVPLKKNDTGQASAPLRKGLHTAIKELAGNSRPNTVKAIVVLMQNNYRYFGDPFAEGAPLDVSPDENTIAPGDTKYYFFEGCNNQDMAALAQQNDIIIYTVYYPWSNSQKQGAVPKKLAEQTGGKPFTADDHVKLNEYLGYIAEDLKRHAGVDTKVDLNFKRVWVSNATSQDSDEGNSHTYHGSDVFDYVYEKDVSTLIQSYDSTGNIFMYPRDDTAAWDANQTLHFDIGTIELDQNWTSTFRLRVKTDGNINITGSASTITFNDGTEILNFRTHSSRPYPRTALLPHPVCSPWC